MRPLPREVRGFHLLTAAVLIAGLAAGLAGCARRGDDDPGALVLIVIDTLRGDRLGSAGYAPAVTPALDSLAVAGLRFRRAMTPVPVTLPAVSSLLTGRLPYRHGVRDNDRFVLGPEETTLAERFRDAGWRTAAVIASGVLAPEFGTAQGFERYDARFEGPYPVYTPSHRYLADEFAATRRRADTVTDLALAELSRFGDESFFLFVHYFDVHMHYDPPPAYAALHPGRPYDGEISFVDAEISRLLEALRARPDALVMVVSDHGESLGEHGEPQHGFLLYESTLHVPVLVAGPGVPADAVREDPISLVDLEPTLAAVFDLPEATPPRDGRALVWEREEKRSVPLYAETFRPLVSYGWRELRAVRQGAQKLIQGPPEEVYDLSEDPREETNLAASRPAPALRRWLEEVVDGDDPGGVLNAAQQQPDPARRELLESLGYVAGSGGGGGLSESRPHPREALPAWLRHQWAKEEFRRAIALVEDGYDAEGVALLDSVLSVSPDFTDARYVRGYAHERRGEYDAAVADYHRCLEEDPEHVAALGGLARAATREGRPEDAHRLWLLVFETDESDESALMHLSGWHLERGEPKRALPYLRRLASLRPDDPVIRYNLGVSALEVGAEAEGREHLEAFLRLAPEDPDAPRARAILAR